MLEIASTIGLILTVLLGCIVIPAWIHSLVLAWKIHKDPEIEFDEESLDFKFFDVAGYDDYVEQYFTDFNNKTNHTYWHRQKQYYKKAAICAGAGLILWYWPLAFVGVGFYATMSLLDKFLMDYYYWTYYEVEMKLVPKEKDEE